MTLKLSYLPSIESFECVEWRWPQSRDLIYFDEILNHQNSLPNFVIEQSQYLSIERLVVGETKTWWLLNQVEDWVCVVNSHTLKTGLKQRLADGDVLEFGLSRFEISLNDLRPSVFNTNSNTYLQFELTDLACDTAALDFLLSEENQSVKPHVPSTAQADESTNADVFVGLHAQYLRRLESPWDSFDEDASWLNIQRGGKIDTFDPMRALVEQAGERSDLADLLGEFDHIDSVIHSLDSQETKNILAPEVYPSVIQLFAPIAFQEIRNQSNSTHGVPGLTQREHHSVSLDSVISTNLKTTQYD